MSSREVFPDEELRHRIMDFIMSAPRAQEGRKNCNSLLKNFVEGLDKSCRLD